jgi:hypothetical protein
MCKPIFRPAASNFSAAFANPDGHLSGDGLFGYGYGYG